MSPGAREGKLRQGEEEKDTKEEEEQDELKRKRRRGRGGKRSWVKIRSRRNSVEDGLET